MLAGISCGKIAGFHAYPQQFSDFDEARAQVEVELVLFDLPKDRSIPLAPRIRLWDASFGVVPFHKVLSPPTNPTATATTPNTTHQQVPTGDLHVLRTVPFLAETSLHPVVLVLDPVHVGHRRLQHLQTPLPQVVRHGLRGAAHVFPTGPRLSEAVESRRGDKTRHSRVQGLSCVGGVGGNGTAEARVRAKVASRGRGCSAGGDGKRDWPGRRFDKSPRIHRVGFQSMRLSFCRRTARRFAVGTAPANAAPGLRPVARGSWRRAAGEVAVRGRLSLGWRGGGGESG
ncbi:hypothetical protein BDY21DRAFT_202450 [Lineolata rhizophorae]|uniref:Uncharacterized protein n=1 Tax=Lineolata rhizophorae TaxID=578093 RepID=A0A6A6P5R6_9PEZI|nr:hypothetical protein BDY21DRAFT_202450 [Lineolata rhizophorae]